jgi:quinol monooxygenase YgiN
MSQPIRVVARIVGRPETLDELAALLEGLVAPTRAEAGCHQYEMLRSTSDPTLFTFVEEWESDAALDAHLATDHL